MKLNQTLYYLYPLLNLYDKKLKSYVYKLGLKELGVKDLTHPDLIDVLFCKCKPSVNSKYIEEYFKDEDYFVTDYLHSDLEHHIYVFKLPEGTTNKFLKGKYSELVPKDKIEEVYTKTVMNNNIEVYTKNYSVVSQRESYKAVFLDMLNEKFNTNLTLNDLDSNAELDFPPKLSDEII